MRHVYYYTTRAKDFAAEATGYTELLGYTMRLHRAGTCNGLFANSDIVFDTPSVRMSRRTPAAAPAAAVSFLPFVSRIHSWACVARPRLCHPRTRRGPRRQRRLRGTARVFSRFPRASHIQYSIYF
jgi:hypothetical protein